MDEEEDPEAWVRRNIRTRRLTVRTLFDHSRELVDAHRQCVARRTNHLGFRLLLHYGGFLRPLLVLASKRQRAHYGQMFVSTPYLGTYVSTRDGDVKVAYDPVQRGYWLTAQGLLGYQLDADFALVRGTASSLFLVRLDEARSLVVTMDQGAVKYGKGTLTLARHWVPENARIYYRAGDVEQEALALVRSAQAAVLVDLLRSLGNSAGSEARMAYLLEEPVAEAMRARRVCGPALANRLLASKVKLLEAVPKALAGALDTRLRREGCGRFLGRDDWDTEALLEDVETVSEARTKMLDAHARKVRAMPWWVWVLEFMLPLLLRFDVPKPLRKVYRKVLWLRYNPHPDHDTVTLLTDRSCQAWLK